MLELIYRNSSTRHTVDFKRESNHVVKVTGAPKNTSGFILTRAGMADGWNYLEYTTVYREKDGSVWYSDDGSVYVDPKETVYVKASWDDEEDYKGIRPDNLIVYTDRGTIVLEKENGWEYPFQVKQGDRLTVYGAQEVPGYTQMISGTEIVLHTDVIKPEEPTIEERVTDLEVAVCELADLLG